MPPTPAARRQQKGNWVLRHLPGNAGRRGQRCRGGLPGGPCGGPSRLLWGGLKFSFTTGTCYFNYKENVRLGFKCRL